MPGSQTDPIEILRSSQQRHADLIADARHDELVDAALQYRAARSVRPEKVRGSRLVRMAALVSATLRQSLRLAPVAPAAVRGG